MQLALLTTDKSCNREFYGVTMGWKSWGVKVSEFHSYELEKEGYCSCVILDRDVFASSGNTQ